jgi:magnesium transporter
MLKKLRYKDITWIDVEAPTEAEISELGTTYDIHPVALAELARPSVRSKVDVYNNFIYLILHFPKLSSTESQEVDFIIGKDFIISTHYEMVNSLNDFAKIFESDFTLKKNHEKLHAGFIFYYMVKDLYASLDNDLNYINDQLKSVEQKVFYGQERQVIKKLSEINRQLLDYRWALKAHGEIWSSLELAGPEIFGTKFGYYLKAMNGEYERIWNAIESNRATFLDLRETNDSLLSIKTNETTRVLTVTAFILLPMTIITQLFGITSNNLPLVDSPNAFPIIVIIAALSSLLTYFVARLKKWI